MSRIGLYDPNSSKWQPLAGGLDQAPTRLSFNKNTNRIRAYGPFKKAFQTSSDTIGLSISNGVVEFSLDSKTWSSVQESITPSDAMISYTDSNDSVNLDYTTSATTRVESSSSSGLLVVRPTYSESFLDTNNLDIENIVLDRKRSQYYVQAINLTENSSKLFIWTKPSSLVLAPFQISDGKLNYILASDNRLFLVGSFSSMTWRDNSTSISAPGLAIYNMQSGSFENLDPLG